MKFSLIIGTLDRPWALESCYNSIINQSYTDFEIIIIDQSNNTETQKIVEKINDDRIIYRHVNYKGLSKSRNEALRLATGDYFCLFDDDAYYQEDYLEVASKNVLPKTILSGYIFDTIRNDDFVNYDKSMNGKKLSLRNIIRTCPSAGLIFPITVIDDCGLFDDRFGVGSIYGAGEETDLILRALKRGYCVKYNDKLCLKHPVPVSTNNTVSAVKAKSYFVGFGALYKKHFSVQTIINGYLETWIKLLVKRLIYKGEKKEIVKAQIDGFIEGFNSYKRK